jgi:TonB family protein
MSMVRGLIITAIILISVTLQAQPVDSTITESNNTSVVRPKIKYKPKLEFPEIAREASLEAIIHVKVAIGKDGLPYKTEITKREPEFVYMFDDEVRRWAMKCEFYPALNKQGEPVSVWMNIPINFRIKDFEPPKILEQPTPEYPTEALEMGLEGWVGLAVLIDKNGIRDRRPLIVSREPSSTKVFDDAAIEVAMDTRFLPAQMEGRDTKGWIFMKVEFNLPKK